MRKVILSLLIFLGLLGILFRFGYPLLVQKMGLQGRAGIKVDANLKTKVFINNREVGVTPFQDENLSEGEVLVALQKINEASSSAGQSALPTASFKDNFLWQGYVKLNSGTLSVVNRDLSDTTTASSGEVITLEAGDGVTIVSTPTEAVVNVDGKERGRTPLTLSDLSSGEHQFIISHENFLNRSIRANLVDGFNLKLNVDLALSEADLTRIATPPVTTSKQVVVKKTPTGFLNVRETASTNGKIVIQVKPGEILSLLEELPNWNRVRTSEGKEGYVSSIYVEKRTQ